MGIREHTYHAVQVSSVKDKHVFTNAWHDIWLEEYYATAADNIVEKYSKYDPFSTDYLLLNAGNEVVGTMRIVLNTGTTGLPVLNDFYINATFSKGEKLCEVTLLTIKKTERQQDHFPTFLLLSELWRYVKEHSISGILIAADIRLWHLLNHKFGLCFTEIGQRKMYEGSLTVPGYLSVNELKEENLLPVLRALLK